MKNLLKTKKFGIFYELIKKHFTPENNPIYKKKKNIEMLLHKLFTSSYTDSNLRIDSNIVNELIQWSKETNEYFELILSKFKARKIKFPTLKPENDQILIYNQSITKKISGYEAVAR